MLFTYLLAFIGLAVLIGLAVFAVLGSSQPAPPPDPESDDPYDAALAAVARLQAAAWTAVHEIRGLEAERENHP